MMSSTAVLIYLRWADSQIAHRAYWNLFSANGDLK
jgi:hypothetical protein